MPHPKYIHTGDKLKTVRPISTFTRNHPYPKGTIFTVCHTNDWQNTIVCRLQVRKFIGTRSRLENEYIRITKDDMSAFIFT